MDIYYPEPLYREDALVNPTTGVGMAKHDPSQSWEISWGNTKTLDRVQQSALASIGLIHRIIYTLPNACCRRWGTVTMDEGDPKVIDLINQAMLKIPVISRRRRRGGGVKEAVRLVMGLAFKTGNGAIILDADDGRSLYEPLDLDNLVKIKSLRVASKWQIVPYFYGSEGPSYSHYQIFAQGYYSPGDEFNMAGTIIHRSRVFWFAGIETDDEFAGGRFGTPGCDRSILDLIVEAFLEYYGGIKGAGRMIQDFDVIVHKIKGLAEMLQSDCAGATNNAKAMVANSTAMNAKARSAFRSYVADMDQESIEHVTRQVGGYDALLQTLKSYLLINTPYPPAVLFGEFSAGLGSSGEMQEERAIWNETGANEQESKITPNLISLDPEFTGILGVVMAQKEGPTKGKILDNVGWQWAPLFDPTPQQQAALEKERSMIIQTLGGIDPRFVSNAILSHYGGQEFNPVITLTDEYKAALEAEAKLEKEPPGGEGEEVPEEESLEEEGGDINAADGGTEDDVDLSGFAEFIDLESGNTDSWDTDLLFPRLDAKRKSKLKVGDTKSKNGKTYVFNDNRRWALKREGGAKPKAKRKSSGKSTKKGPQPGDTKVNKAGKTLVFNGDTRRWRLQKPEDVKAAKSELKKAVEKKGAKLTPSEAREVIEGSAANSDPPKKAANKAEANAISIDEYKKLDVIDKQLAAPGQDNPPQDAPLKAQQFNPHAKPDMSPQEFVEIWGARERIERQDTPKEIESSEGDLLAEQFFGSASKREDPNVWRKSFTESGLKKAAYRRAVSSAIESGLVPPDEKWIKANLKKNRISNYEKNKAQLKKDRAIVAEADKAIKYPLMTDSEAKGYKPTLSKKEAQKYAQNSFLGDLTMYHGNSSEVVDSIRNEGSRPELNTAGIYGQGTYFAAFKHTAESYANALADSNQSQGLVGVKTKVKNPYVATRDELDKVSQWFSGGSFGAEQSNGINSQALTEYIRAKGHDSIYLKDHGYLVSFDGRQTVAFEYTDMTQSTPEGKNARQRHQAYMDDPQYDGMPTEAKAVSKFFKDSGFEKLGSTDTNDYGAPNEEDDFF